MGQFIFYCGAVAKTATLSNINVPFTGSTAAPGSMATSAAASSTVTASPLAAPSNTLVPGLISFSSFSSVPTSSKSTLPSTLTTGIPSSVPSNATTTNDLPTNDQSSSSTLPAGIIAAISIGCLAVVVLILCMVFNHFTTDWRRRIALPNQHNGTPRGTLGGATLPGGTPPAPTYDTESKWNPNPVDENGLGISNMENQESLAMLRRELQQPAPVSNPWSANSIGLGRQVGSSELDGSTMYTLSVNRPIGASSGKGVGDTGVGVSPNALVAGRQPQTSHQRLSAAVSEMGSLAPGGSGSSGGSRPLSPMTISSQTNGATNGMTARGSWKGYMSAETAMAGGWRDDEAHSCN
ncbi:hypothetical protein MMC13_001303 [Lambiella insularis]|nr:hypothetical protein [Lambiella insularis]